MASRRLPVFLVILVSQVAALALCGVLIVTLGSDPPSGRRLLYGAAAGVAGAIGLSAFYRGLKIGAMGVVAPIAATAVLVPVAVGLARGERPSGLQAVGVALALSGVLLGSLEPEREALRDRRFAAGAGLALVAALCFGSAVTGLQAASKGGPLWAVFMMRASAAPVAIGLVLVARVRIGRGFRLWPLVAAVGMLDAGASVLFGAAANRGLLSVVSVLASLYPVIVVLLARLVLAERLARLQLVGAAAALAGVALISAG